MNKRNRRPQRGQQSQLTVVGRYSVGEVELKGNAESLRGLSTGLRPGGTSVTYTLYVPQNASPAPYDKFLTSLRVVQSEGVGQVVVDVDGDVLVIAGSQDKLSVLADVINDLADEPEPESGVKHHVHVEYYPDHFYLDPTSIPLVLSVGGLASD